MGLQRDKDSLIETVADLQKHIGIRDHQLELQRDELIKLGVPIDPGNPWPQFSVGNGVVTRQFLIQEEV